MSSYDDICNAIERFFILADKLEKTTFFKVLERRRERGIVKSDNINEKHIRLRDLL